MLLRLVCTDETLVNGPGYLAANESYRVGRSSRCSFVVHDLSVSRFHAQVTTNDDSVNVKDLGSRNGTFVDGVRVSEVEIQPGQTVRFGSVQFQLLAYDEPLSGSELSEVSTRLVKLPATAQPAKLELLSESQRRVLGLLLEGKAEKEVAAKLNISPHTVHNHVKEIYRKMEVNSRPELFSLFLAESKKPGLK